MFTIRAREGAVQDSEDSVNKMHEKDSETSVDKMHEKNSETSVNKMRGWEMENRRWKMGDALGPPSLRSCEKNENRQNVPS